MEEKDELRGQGGEMTLPVAINMLINTTAAQRLPATQILFWFIQPMETGLKH